MTLFARPDHIPDDRLHVVTCVFNPNRARSRFKLSERFVSYMETSGAVLYIAEAAFGARDFVVTDPSNPRHVRVRVRDEFFCKENLLNLAAQRVPDTARYVAWVDADIQAARPDWCNETLHVLQHHPVAQMWSHAVDLGPDHQPVEHHTSFAEHWRQGGKDRPAKYGGKWHPGLAWAFRREVLDELGGLLECCITGGGDWLMSWAMLGEVEEHTWKDWSPGFKGALLEFQRRAAKCINKDIGVVPGLVSHYWHGPKKGRCYDTRERVLVDSQFDPGKDLLRHVDGGLGLADDGSDRMRRLREALRRLGRARNEDSTELDTTPTFTAGGGGKK